MSKLGNALNNMQTPGSGRLRGNSASMKYGNVQVQEKKAGPSWIDSVARFAQAGADAYQAYDTKQQKTADERSNEIIRKLTPEQRREALNNGTLLYQDDPYAMEALRFKTGRNAAFQVDNEISEAIKRGEFRSRTELDERRHARLQEVSKDMAEQFGINEADVDYQRGFNADITDRNINLYGTHDAFLSDQAQKGAVLNSKVELDGVLKDPNVLRRPESGEFFSKYIDNGLVSGAIPSDAQATQIISGSLNDVVQRPGATEFLMSLKDKKVKLNGAETTYGQLMGEEQWNSLMVKAQSSQFQNNAKLYETHRLRISSAVNQPDATVGWEMLQQAKAELDKLQPGEEMTPERQELLAAEDQMKNRFATESAATAKAMDDQKKTFNKSNVIDAQFDKRLKGEYVSTNYTDMPTNENTGEFKHSDMVNYANKKLAQIEAMDVDQQTKDRLKLDYLRVDSKDGPFRTAVGQLVTDAGQEWSGAVINGKLPESTPAMDSLRRLRNSNPQLVAALYPDQAELFLTMDMLDSQGVDTQVLIDADRAQRGKTKEMQFEDDRAWASLKNNSQSPELSRIPASLDGMARKVYESYKYRTGNADGAMAQVDKFLKESTATFTDNDMDGKTYGILPKNMLQVTDDPKSWEQGKAIIDAANAQLIKANPWITNEKLSVTQSGNMIRVMDMTGRVGYTMDADDLRREYQQAEQKKADAAREQALKDAQKRAPITQATKAREEGAKRVRANKRKVPKYIYGKQND